MDVEGDNNSKELGREVLFTFVFLHISSLSLPSLGEPVFSLLILYLIYF
jgi:hypothetical protein